MARVNPLAVMQDQAVESTVQIGGLWDDRAVEFSC